VAAQPQLGLCSKRRARIGRHHIAGVDFGGTALKNPRESRPAWFRLALVAGVLAVTGCATVQQVLPTKAGREARARNEGYSLLYQLLGQESDVAKILIIKHADAPVTEVIKEISAACTQAKGELDAFHEKDHHLSFVMSNLPKVEQETRAAIQSTDTKELLFSSGKTFEQRLLFTQAQAMNYAAHLAQVLHDQEKDTDRKDFLAKLDARCTALHDKVIGLMQ
jgi:hypothetical protein